MDEWIDDLVIIGANDAKEAGLVDDLAVWEDVKNIVSKLEGANKSFIGPEETARYEYPSVMWGEPDRVAVVYAIGGTQMDSGMNCRQVQKTIRHLKRDKTVKAVVLRVNSPGGDALASNVVAEAIRDCQKVKPVIISQADVAASGGYWVSMYGDEIVAQPTTITGSIGVISAGLNLTGLMDKVGVADQTFTSGPMKDAGSPFRPMTPAERAYIQGIIDDLDHRFEEVVAVGRPALQERDLERLADGRAYTAVQAEQSGLVDAIGYLPDAVDELERRLGVPEVRVVSYHRDREWRENLYSARPALPPARADLLEALGPYRGPAFLYLWQPGL